MDVRSPLFQNIALIVAGVLFLNPIVATAAQLTVDQAAGGNTAVTQAQNGVPMVNIATPNGSGLSHNKFTDYNVGQQGLILNNNAQNLVQTQLGGYVVGNPNLKNGAAGLILNEVTGGNASQLKGYTEVAGRSAAVIVANPHGITCDGCGFINTPRVTLSTGTPVVEDGRLQRFDVDGGQIAIEGQGLNAGNVDQFDLITRSAQINAELHAKKLNIVTGRNEVDATTLAVTAKADDGSNKPMLAIDSSALGGMYAGAIRLVGTEQGVGVKLAGDMAASAGDIQIDANGKLSLARVAASNDLKLAANEIELNADTYAGRNATVTAMDQTLVKESLAAGNRLEIGGGELDNQGVVEAGVKANGALVTDSQLVLNSQRVSNRGELIARGSLEADVEVLDNSNGKLLSAGNAKIQAAQLANSQGQIIAQKSLELGGGALSNQDGELLAAGELRVDAASLNNQGGILAADSIDVKLTGALNNGQGLIESSQALKLDVDSAQNHDGRLRALASSGKSEFQIGNLFDNDRGLVEVGNAAFALASSSLSNLGGTVRHLGTQGFDLNLADLGNAGGRFITNGELNLSAADWTNTSELQAERLTLNIGQFTQAATGQLISRQSITATGDNWVNDGVIATDGSLDLTLSGSYEGNGALRSLGDLTFKAASAEFGSDAQAKSGGVGRFELSGQLLNQGRLTAAQDMFLTLGSLDNRGALGGSGLLRIEADSLRNEQGLIFSGADMTLRTVSLVNLLGDIYSLGELDVARDELGGNLDLLDNRSSSIESTGDMTLRAALLRNRKDVFDWQLTQTYGWISVRCYDCGGDHHNVDYIATERFTATVEADSASSRIHSGANLTLKGDEIANRYSTMSAVDDIDIDAASLENTGATLASVQRMRTFNTGRVTDGTDERYRAAHINPYNSSGLPKTVPGALYNFRLVSDIQTETPIGVAAPGIIQAGGDVRIQATQPITNESVLAHNAPQASTEQTLETTVGGASAPLVVQLNPQLPADTAQQAVDPISLPGFSLPQGQNGLFQTNTDPGHRYLIETNPAFADLKQFVSSDYMLGLLGFDNDAAQKRLGDGLYEQRLLEQAVAARTGKRYLDGFTNNDAQFRYLMDNAIASKDALSLSVGIGLSSAQVAALTHDIVWLEEREVNGEKVLVPVLYLAQVGDRLAPSGALIQGQDVALISGGNLNNSGTLRASENLSVSAASIGNSGLMQASDRLQLLATNSIRNAQGGIINGQDVSLIALTGDISNERTISQQSLSGKGFSQLTSVVDNAAGIEAGNDLQLLAGGDIQNIGGSLKAGGDAKLNAGGDVIIASAAEEHGSMRKDKRHFWSTTSTTQHGSDVQVGGNLAVTAAQDIAVVASAVKADGDVLLDAGRDVTIAAAANESGSEYRYKRSGKKVDKADSNLRQQASVIEVGGDLDVSAGRDLTLVASQLRAANDIDLDAGQDVNILSDRDESASYYFKSKKGSFGRSKSEQRESYGSTNIASVIDAGNDLTINTSKTAGGGLSIDGGRDVTVIGSQLSAGNDLLVGATGDVAILSGVEEHGSYSKKTKSGFLGMSKSGKSQLKTSATQVASELEAGNDVVIAAGNDVRLRASTTEAGNDVELRSGLIKDTGDINLVSANDTAYSLTEQYRKKTGLSVSGGMLSVSSAKKAGQEARSSTSVGSHIAAERDASLLAERDINVIGSSVSAGRNLLLDAGRDVNVAAAQNQQGSTAWERERRTGIGLDSDRNGFTAFVGNDVQTEKGLNTRQTAASSSLEAGNDLDVKVGRDANLSGSDFSAGRDISVLAERDINLDAATERYFQEQQELHQRNGLTVNVSHNFGNTVDAIKGVGQGDNLISQVSGVLKAADAVTQFVSGPTTANHLGTTRQQTTTTDGVLSNRPTTMDAGRDVNLQAGNDINAKGSQIHAERDINMSGRDITLDVARGQQTSSTKQVISQNGINSGTTFNSARTGVGGSHGVHREEGTQGTALATQLQAGRDIHLDASRDLELIGTRAEAGRDISLVAGNDIDIRAAQNDSEHEMRRKSGGGEVGLALGGQDFISVYASVDIGKGRLDREAGKQQEAYLYAGKQLSFESGRDTTVAGARLEGQDVVGKVGRDLLVSSVPDTGKVSGKELDASLTVSVGLYGSVSVSGSVGVGKTNGSTNWVENQTGIVARDRLDIRTENHTQLDGALLASDSGNLKLDTGTLGFRDIEGHDREHAWYINAGGTYSWGSDSGSGGQPADGNAAATSAVVDPSQQNKDGSNNWNLSGYDYRKEREQIVRATVGEGEIVVRSDSETGHDSTAGLNRDVSKAYKVTKDKEERTELYVSKSSLEAVSDPVVTLEQWKKSVEAYGENSEKALNELSKLFVAVTSIAEGDSLFEVEHKLIKHEIVKSLGDRNLEKRQEAARNIIDRVPGQATEAQRQAIVDYVANMAAQDPEGAFLLLSKLNFAAQGNPLQSHFAQAGTAALLVVGAVLLVAATNPESMNNMTQLGNTIMESVGQAGVAASDQIKVSAEIWWILVGSGTVFPIHQLDPKYGPLVNPVVDVNGQNPASGGYAEGGRIITTPHTGGSQLDGQQGGTSYTNPEHQLNPGNMYSWTGNASDFEREISRLPPGERVARVKETVQIVAESLGLEKDSRLTKLNNRDVYRGVDGFLYAVDTQHGRFEKVDPKKGRHLGEVDMNLTPIKDSLDTSGGHDLRIK
ncbi:hemagglutinin repeat-containing protein [Pseudomonas sp. B11D7D]|nr:hemagglutinin repeat-containing protein [Pseudomonas sp. B11D7D]